MRYVYIVALRSDATGFEDQEIFGTERRARRYLRLEGYTEDVDYPRQFTNGDGDVHAHLQKVRVR